MPAKCILLVDDEPETFDLLAHRLRGLGYAVDAVINAADAWRCLGGQRYALVIADWQLPDRDGIVIADAAADLGAKTVVISGYALGEVTVELAREHRPDLIVLDIQLPDISGTEVARQLKAGEKNAPFRRSPLPRLRCRVTGQKSLQAGAMTTWRSHRGRAFLRMVERYTA